MLDQEHFVELVGGDFVSERRDTFADDYGGERTFCLLHDLLRGGESFEADFVPLAFALFGDEKNFHCLTCILRNEEQISRSARDDRLLGVITIPALLGDSHRTRASCFSFSISFAATSFGWPVMNSVFLVFCGM